MVVLIPTYKRTDLLEKLLQSLLACQLPTGFAYFLVIENGSSVARPTVEKFDKKLPLRYLQTDEGNKSKALNLGMEALAPDDFILFFDDDIIVDPTIFIRYAEAIKRAGPGHFYGGEVYPLYEVAPGEDLIPFLPLSSTGQLFNPAVADGEDFQRFLGCNWGAYTGDLARTEGFNGEVGPGAKSSARGQETDMQAKLADQGCKPVRVFEAGVHHYVPARTLTEEWVLDRVQKSAMWHGSGIASSKDLTRHVLRFAAFGALSLTGKMDYKVRARRHLGVLKGYWGKSSK